MTDASPEIDSLHDSAYAALRANGMRSVTPLLLFVFAVAMAPIAFTQPLPPPEPLNEVIKQARALGGQRVRIVACLSVDIHGIMLEDCRAPNRMIFPDAKSEEGKRALRQISKAGWSNYPNNDEKVQIDVVGTLEVRRGTRDLYRLTIEQVLGISEPIKKKASGTVRAEGK